MNYNIKLNKIYKSITFHVSLFITQGCSGSRSESSRSSAEDRKRSEAAQDTPHSGTCGGLMLPT